MNFIKIEGLIPKRKYLSFVSALRNSNVRLIRNSAFLDIKQITSVLEDVIIKLTINEDNSLIFEQTEGSFCDNNQLQRIFDMIEEYEHTTYAHKYILSDLYFKDENGDLCYLEIEYQRPVDRFNFLIDELLNEKKEESNLIENIEKNSNKDITTILDDLIGLDEDYKEDENKNIEKNEFTLLDTKEKSYLEKILEDSKKEQKEKIENRISEKEKELLKEKIEINNLNSKIKKIENDVQLLRSRLLSMKDPEELNGYIFSVSEQINIPILLDNTHDNLLNTISNNLGIDRNKLNSIITESSYKIFIKSKNNTLDIKDSYTKLYLIDTNGYFQELDNGIILYKGNLTWHKIIDGMIKSGFSQDSNFDNELGHLKKLGI